MLAMAALELGNPMLLFVLVEADDLSVHAVPWLFPVVRHPQLTCRRCAREMSRRQTDGRAKPPAPRQRSKRPRSARQPTATRWIAVTQERARSGLRDVRPMERLGLRDRGNRDL